MTDGPQTLFRQWSMLRAIPTAPRKIDVARILERLASDGFDTTARTVQRDLQKLSAVFPLVCDERSRPFGWSWMQDTDPLDIPAMSPQAALTLRLAREHLAPVMPPSTLRALAPHMRRADAVLDQVAGGVTSWPNKVRIISPVQPFAPPDVAPEVLETIYTAVGDERAVRLLYRKREADAPREYDAHPLALVGRDNVFYLVAALWDYDNVVQLALHRVEAVELMGPRRAIEFNLDAYIARGEFGFLIDESVDLELEVDATVVTKLAETPLGPGQQIELQEGGRGTIRVTVPDTSQLRGWLLSYGPLIEVKSPAPLREAIAQRLSAASALYGTRNAAD